MTQNTLSTLYALTAAATFAFLSAGAITTAQAAPHVAVVVHTGSHAHGQPVYQPVHRPDYRPDVRPNYRPGYRPEAASRPRPGHHWVAGHWKKRGKHAVWQTGHWERSRPAYRPHYGAVRYPNGQYGNHNPYRQNGQYGHYGKPQPPRWDRDGDGVPNRHDRRPNNPYRN